MTEKPRGPEERGAQEVTAGERAAQENPANAQELEKPAEGRDVPPAEVPKGKRNANSPWMGGG